MNIFYFNITYSCDSNCVFCYSHNTIHTGHIHKEITANDFIEYLNENNVLKSDRVIINGGEPFLHSDIISILQSLLEIGCEVLIYTNGRNIKKYDLNFLTSNYRFIIPIHGHRTLHDKITRCEGSFDSMLEGLSHLNSYKCKIDIKVILNPLMIESDEEFFKTLYEIEKLPFNNSIHITKMADTIISKKNNLSSVSNDLAAHYTKIIFEHFANKNYVLKMFDTCVKDINVEGFENRDLSLNVLFKDHKTQWHFDFYTPEDDCRKECRNRDYCQSAVGNYTVLEYNEKFYIGLE